MTETRAQRARRIQQAGLAGESTIVTSLTPANYEQVAQTAQPEHQSAPEPGSPTEATVTLVAPPPTPAPQPATTKDTTVRFTLDMTRSDHRRLKMLALDNEVPAADIIRSMFAGLDDEQISALVQKRQAPEVGEG